MGVDAQGIIDSVYGGAGHINRGVLPGHARCRRPGVLRLRPGEGKQMLDKSSWDKSKPLRIVFDKSFAGVEQWTPIMQQNLQDIGFKVELMVSTPRPRSRRTTRSTRSTSRSPRAARRVSGRSSRRSTSAASRPSRPTTRPIRGTARSTTGFVAARKEIDPEKRTEIFKRHQQAHQRRGREGRAGGPPTL